MNTINEYGRISSSNADNSKRRLSSKTSNSTSSKQTDVVTVKPLVRDSAEVVQTLAQNMAKSNEQARIAQEVSANIMGRKFQFSVDKEFGLIVEIVDPKTDKVIKEIPSTDSQKIQTRVEKALGLIFDKTV
ncbi:MAG: flagellar protein FlaG [Treponema sp.]|nr:flagellar protein FlaG [Treponema sp.]